MILANFLAGLRELFTLGVARATVQTYGPEQLELIRREKGLARVRLSASRRLVDPFTALDVLSIAAHHARSAQERASSTPAPVLPVPPEVPATFARAEAARDELEDALASALTRIEARRPMELNGLRVGRLAAVVVAFATVIAWVVRAHGVHNVALDKAVAVSSVRDGQPEALVDGRTRGTYAVQTLEGAQPSVTIDLGRMYRIRRVRVFNRGDGWFDEVLPLALEVSSDGSTFQEVARRTEHFDVWTADVLLDARWVRLTKDKGYIALNEIEVYARE